MNEKIAVQDEQGNMCRDNIELVRTITPDIFCGVLVVGAKSASQDGEAMHAHLCSSTSLADPQASLNCVRASLARDLSLIIH